MVRIRIEKPEYDDIEQYTIALVIKWQYENSNETELPSEIINNEQLAFERTIDKLLRDNSLSYLIQVTTGLGLKEWLFYTKDKEKFIRMFNKYLKGHKKYPINIEFFEDSDWKIWANFLNCLRSN